MDTLLNRGTEKRPETPERPLACVPNLRAERKATLGSRRSRPSLKDCHRGFVVLLVARFEPNQRATAVSSRAAETEWWLSGLDGGTDAITPLFRGTI